MTWLPGETPTNVTTSLVDPASKPDVEQYFAETRYDRALSGNTVDLAKLEKGGTWNAGATWDRNLEAGILGRTVAFAGLGNVWWGRDDLKFNTAYSLSYTSRDEENPDPEKDDRFVGVRFSWNYLNRWGQATTFENDWFFNISLADRNDWSSNMTTSLDVAMNRLLALKVSLQWLYNNEPALEEVDVVANVELIDPDGIPGSGDEFFETVQGGGTEILLGEDRVRRKKLDTVFRTSLSIRF